MPQSAGSELGVEELFWKYGFSGFETLSWMVLGRRNPRRWCDQMSRNEEIVMGLWVKIPKWWEIRILIKSHGWDKILFWNDSGLALNLDGTKIYQNELNEERNTWGPWWDIFGKCLVNEAQVGSYSGWIYKAWIPWWEEPWWDWEKTSR